MMNLKDHMNKLPISQQKHCRAFIKMTKYFEQLQISYIEKTNQSASSISKLQLKYGGKPPPEEKNLFDQLSYQRRVYENLQKFMRDIKVTKQSKEHIKQNSEQLRKQQKQQLRKKIKQELRSEIQEDLTLEIKQKLQKEKYDKWYNPSLRTVFEFIIHYVAATSTLLVQVIQAVFAMFTEDKQGFNKTRLSIYIVAVLCSVLYILRYAYCAYIRPKQSNKTQNAGQRQGNGTQQNGTEIKLVKQVITERMFRTNNQIGGPQ